MDLAAIRKGFVDREKVIAAMKRGKQRGLSRFGAFVRTRARSSIRRRKKSSTPGQPPSAHVKLGLKLIFFAWDDRTESVVVGPAEFNAKRVGGGVVPRLLEMGGDLTVTTPKGLSKRRHYAAFPYMAPALEAEAPKFPKAFANTVQ